jgi:RNA polymerase sigma factor (sigma-70 family)
MDIRNNWKEYENRAVKPLWNIYSSRYLTLGISYEDFVNIAFIILDSELKKYKSDRASIYTYSINVLKRRMGDYIRNNFNTDKTRANFCTKSLNVPVSDENEITLEESLVDPKTVYKPENNIQKIKRFYKTLSSQQRDVLFMQTIGLNTEEIQDVLEISPEELLREIRRIKSPRKISKLRNEVV